MKIDCPDFNIFQSGEDENEKVGWKMKMADFNIIGFGLPTLLINLKLNEGYVQSYLICTKFTQASSLNNVYLEHTHPSLYNFQSCGFQKYLS